MWEIITNYGISVLGFVSFGYISGLFGQQVSGVSMGSQYKTLIMPSWAPPGWLFGVAWTILYALMGVGFVNLIHANSVMLTVVDLKVFLLVWFALQYGLNFAWTIAYLSSRKISTSIPMTITLAGFAIAMTLVTFLTYFLSGGVNMGYLCAGACFLPYALWTTFASILQWNIAALNP